MRTGLICKVLAALAIVVPWCGTARAVGAEGVRIVALEPTPLFPRVKPGEPLRQVARLKLQNDGPTVKVRVKVTLAGQPARLEALGRVATGPSVTEIHIPDVAAPTELGLELLAGESPRPVDNRRLVWQPQKKWSIYCVAYSHHDLGFGDYPHRLRTTIRHANITRPLQFCRDTDGWDDDSKFRFMIETSEPITSFLGSQPLEVAEDLARRLREGRIQIGGMHVTANTEELGHEAMARMFYLSNLHARDLLGAPKSRTGQIDDVIGLTWPLATFCAAADVPYFFHGPNGCGHCFEPAADEPVFYWQGPSPGSRVLVRSVSYGGYAGDNPGDLGEARVLGAIEKLGAKWPYDALFLQEGTDFQLVGMETATRIHAWNARWAYPRVVCATMDMFFDAIVKQAAPGQIKTFAGDGNNQWADQDANDARTLGAARRLGEAIPTAEKFATIAQVVAGGGYPWADVYQAYHRLLAWHEHTNAIDVVGPNLERMRRYETELEENREMIREAGQYTAHARTSAFDRIASAITRGADRTLIVFNPLTRKRTDTVRDETGELRPGDRLVDTVSGEEIPWQTMPGGTATFVARDVPSLGYRTFAVTAGKTPAGTSATAPTDALENRFFRVAFDPATGTITSIRDKLRNVELVDQAAPHRFNEYLYERFETSDWKAPTIWHRVKTATLKTTSGPVAQAMVVSAHPVGVEALTQTVVLYHEIPRIDFVLDLVKAPSGRRDTRSNADPRGKEAVYVALPLAVAGPQIRHELPGCVSEPVKDLFEGANTAHYAVRHFSDASNARFGVTVSATDSALVQHDRPRSTPLGNAGEDKFEKDRTPIVSGRMYLYLMNNMFDVNVCWDQPGRARFAYALRSHDGDWRQGKADEFGWDTMNPLVAVPVHGKNTGALPAAGSFVSISPANVVCTTLKPAEANGAGFIIRLMETQGQEATATVALPFLGPIASATVTNLVEDDRPEPLAIAEGNRFTIPLRPFAVRTVRVTCRPGSAPAVPGLTARPVADMEVALAWQAPAGYSDVSHYHVYRGTRPDFAPGLLNLVERPVGTTFDDHPQLHHGGWINNRLEPATTYYYRVAAVDRWNNVGPASPAVAATTLKSSEKNLPPRPVECLRAVLVSPMSRFNVVNLLWRTACESDIRRYEVHRTTTPGFQPQAGTRIAVVDADAVLQGGREYGQTPIAYRLREFDHQMYLDKDVQPMTTYFYRVAAVDTAGQIGPFSDEVQITTKGPDPLTALARSITAQSVYAPEYRVELAVDGSPDPNASWISRPYGGGTKQKPLDTWWQVEFGQKPLVIRGVKIVGDERPGRPRQENLQIQVRKGEKWSTVGTVRKARSNTVQVDFPQVVSGDALRVFVPAADLPRSTAASQDGIVRICELLLVLPDGSETTVLDWLGKP